MHQLSFLAVFLLGSDLATEYSVLIMYTVMAYWPLSYLAKISKQAIDIANILYDSNFSGASFRPQSCLIYYDRVMESQGVGEPFGTFL